MPGLTLEQVKALCAGRKNLGDASLKDVLDEVASLEADGLANLNGSRSALDDFVRDLYYQDAFDIEETPTGDILITCPGAFVRVDVKHPDVRPGGTVVAELHFVAPEHQGRPARLLHQARVNLLSSSDREYLLRALQRHAEGIPWNHILSRVYEEVISRVRRGGDGGTIGIGPDPEPIQELAPPFLPMGEPTVFFGHPESLKSFTALLLAVCVQLPWRTNPFGWHVPEKPTNCLYLDYEATQARVDARLRMLMRGHFSDMQLPIEYLPGALSLSDDVDRVLAKIIEKDIGLLVIDSLGGAAGGDLNSAESALRFYSAVRRLGVTTLIIAHTSKDSLQRDKSIYGSTFFNAYARSTWECERINSGEFTPVVETALINRKQNDGPHREAIGLRFTFKGNASVTAEPFDPGDAPSVIAKGGVSKIDACITYLANAEMPVDINEIAEHVGCNTLEGRASLNTQLTRKCRTATNPQGVVVKLPRENQREPNKYVHVKWTNTPQQGAL